MVKVLKAIKYVLIVIICEVLMLGTLFGAWLQTSYNYCPPSEEEIAQMSWFERLCYGER